MKENIRKARVIKKTNNFPSHINALCALSDGRLAIGGENLIIYNMKTYKSPKLFNIRSTMFKCFMPLRFCKSLSMVIKYFG